MPVILIQTRQVIPFVRPYRRHPNGVRMLLIARKRVRAPPTLSSATVAAIAQWIMAPPSLSSGSSSGSSSPSSLETPHSASTSPPRKRLRVLIYSSPSSALLSPPPSVGPSRKRCRSPTPPLPASTIMSLLHTDLVPPRKRFRGTLSAPQEGVHAETTIVSFEMEIVALHARVRAVEQQDEISQDSLGIARDMILILQFRADTAEHRITELLDSRDIDRLEMAELLSRAQDAEARLWPIERLLGLP
ncbi:hypothetical protein Tco_1123555 [Tanacetum coccineum]|uniref:Uncharacterized protein n=1 Tax=Tanacetum coccineum TaxID=301880 RepID=A0ABQ5J3Q2_9ASTR